MDFALPATRRFRHRSAFALDMKKIVSTSLIIFIAALGIAGSNLWRNDVRPTLPLVEAVNLATEALNKNGGDFYCLGAGIVQEGRQCTWNLSFGSTNGIIRWAEVTGDKRVTLRSDGPRLHYK